jgi:hypothetical protein
MIAERVVSLIALFDRDALPSFGAPPLQHRPAGFLAHARPETMNFVVFPRLGLVCPLGHNLR